MRGLAVTHLHSRYASQGQLDRGDYRCYAVCGAHVCDQGTEPVAYRDLNPEDVTCPMCTQMHARGLHYPPEATR